MEPILEPGSRRRILLGLFLCWVFLSGAVHSIALEDSQGTLTGTITDPSGKPAAKFRLVFRAEDGETEFTSSLSDKLGKYSLSLPVGSSYLLIAAIAPDGSRLQVPQLPPIPMEEGVRRLDLRFGFPQEEERKAAAMFRDLPWWQIGGAAVAVIVLTTSVFDDDDEESRASPFTP